MKSLKMYRKVEGLICENVKDSIVSNRGNGKCLHEKQMTGGRGPKGRLESPPWPQPSVPTGSTLPSYDQGHPHLQQPQEASGLQVLPAL